MSEIAHDFRQSQVITRVMLPFVLRDVLTAWNALRTEMARSRVPAEYTRDEWAYLIAFLNSERMELWFSTTFGSLESSVMDGLPAVVARSRSPIALWLPNNVSLLGPLCVVVLAMSGAEVRVKTGSRSVNLVEPFLRFIREKGEKSLVALLERIQIVQGDRESLAVQNLAKDSMLRVVFGSDAAALNIRALSGPPTAQTIAFSHHRSEAWIEWECVTEDLVDSLIRVFAIYGQAGCTAPSRVILIDATAGQAMSLSDRVCQRWPKILGRQVRLRARHSALRRPDSAV